MVIFQNFHFTMNDPPGKAKEDRDKVKIHLARLVGRVTSKKPDKGLEEKRKILQENPELRKLYQDLVVPGMILPEEFWSSRAHLINQSGQQSKFSILDRSCLKFKGSALTYKSMKP